jgi:hypothetical protein
MIKIQDDLWIELNRENIRLRGQIKKLEEKIEYLNIQLENEIESHRHEK